MVARLDTAEAEIEHRVEDCRLSLEKEYTVRLAEIANQATEQVADAERKAMSKMAEITQSSEIKVAECKAECDRKVSEAEGKNSELLQQVGMLEQKNADLEQKVADLESENSTLKAQAAGQGSTYKAVVKKLMQTVDFGQWCYQLLEGAKMWGKNLVLKQLMESDPRLLLKKKSLGWDPYCE